MDFPQKKCRLCNFFSKHIFYLIHITLWESVCFFFTWKYAKLKYKIIKEIFSQNRND